MSLSTLLSLVTLVKDMLSIAVWLRPWAARTVRTVRRQQCTPRRIAWVCGSDDDNDGWATIGYGSMFGR
jgi:hypothetical protein